MIRGLRGITRWAIRSLLAVALIVAGGVLYDTAYPPVSTLMLGRMLTGQAVDRRPLPLSVVSDNLVAAVLMSEDGQFCVHHGVDWTSLNQVVSDPDGPSRGASTITMQLAKNLFLWPGRSYLRKALEIPTALLLELLWGKRRILQAYLDIAEWGPGIFGAEAAAQRSFHKPASQLSRREAALLATALPNPILRDAARPTRLHRTLAATVQARMASAGPWLLCLR